MELNNDAIVIHERSFRGPISEDDGRETRSVVLFCLCKESIGCKARYWVVECVGETEVLGVEERSNDEVEAVKAACTGFPLGRVHHLNKLHDVHALRY